MITRLKECLENKTGSYAAPFLWMHGEEKDRIREELEKFVMHQSEPFVLSQEPMRISAEKNGLMTCASSLISAKKTA